MLDTRFQPGIESLLLRLGQEISARAVLLLHENGQVLHQFGKLPDEEYPAMAALVAAMVATGKSLGRLGASFESPRRLSCDSDELGLYTVCLQDSVWLVALYEQPVNPGLVRMKVRRCAEACVSLGVERVDPTPGLPPRVAPSQGAEARAALLPATAPAIDSQAKITEGSSLFHNITDDEIDRLFENTHS